jgi:hypothetical protein
MHFNERIRREMLNTTACDDARAMRLGAAF